MTIKLEFLELIALQWVAKNPYRRHSEKLDAQFADLDSAGLIEYTPIRGYIITELGLAVLKAHLPYGEFNSYIHHIARENLKHSRKKELEEQHNSSQYLANRFSPLKPN